MPAHAVHALAAERQARAGARRGRRHRRDVGRGRLRAHECSDDRRRRLRHRNARRRRTASRRALRERRRPHLRHRLHGVRHCGQHRAVHRRSRRPARPGPVAVAAANELSNGSAAATYKEAIMLGVTNRFRAFSGGGLAISAALAVATGGAAAGAARADVPTCDAATEAPYALTAQALQGPTRTDVYANITSAPDGCPVPEVLKKVRVKALADDGSTASVGNYFDVKASDGVGIVLLDGLSRHERLEVTALVQTPEAVRTVVLKTETTVRLRPDLTVKLRGPTRVVRKQPFAYEATVSEIANDTGAGAIVSLYDGVELLAQKHVSVPAGEETTVTLDSLRIGRVATHDLLVRVSGASPAESESGNDTDTGAVAVARYDLDGAVVSENSQATEIGGEILREGGNAFDAAAAVQWALNLAEPENTGLGGGVNAIVHLANGDEFAIDGRETAPGAVTPTYYASKKNFSLNGFSVGVPGTLRTMDYMLGRWGTMTLAQTLQPAIELGEKGVVVSEQLATSIRNRGRFDPDTKKIFYPNGVPLPGGATYRNPDLVKTFRLIAAEGPTVFYEGEIAPAIVAAQQKSFDPGMGGVMTTDDLKSFAVDVTKPISIDYHGYDVETVGPSSGAGIVLLQMLEMVDLCFPEWGSAPDWGFQSANATQVLLETMRLGFRDKEMWMGDNRPGFYADMPLAALLSPTYLAQRCKLINAQKRIAPTYPGDPRGYDVAEPPGEPETADRDTPEGGHTTHFSIIDRWGNIVSETTTLGDGLGSTITVPGYGFLLNDAGGRLFDDNKSPFAGKDRTVIDGGVLKTVKNPGANDAAGGKRGVGNVAPVIVLKDHEPVLVTGGAGGDRITPAVFQVITNVIDFQKSLRQALEAPRIAGDLNFIYWNCAADPVPPWFDGAPQFPQDTLDALKLIGDRPNPATPNCQPYPWVGGTASLAVDPDTYSLSAAADPRGLPAVSAPFLLAPQ